MSWWEFRPGRDTLTVSNFSFYVSLPFCCTSWWQSCWRPGGVLVFFTCFLPGFKTRFALPVEGEWFMWTPCFMWQWGKAPRLCGTAVWPLVPKLRDLVLISLLPWLCSWPASLSQGTAELLGSSRHIQGRPKPLLVRNLRPSEEGDENSIYMLSLFLIPHIWAECLPWKKVVMRLGNALD